MSEELKQDVVSKVDEPTEKEKESEEITVEDIIFEDNEEDSDGSSDNDVSDGNEDGEPDVGEEKRHDYNYKKAMLEEREKRKNLEFDYYDAQVELNAAKKKIEALLQTEQTDNEDDITFIKNTVIANRKATIAEQQEKILRAYQGMAIKEAREQGLNVDGADDVDNCLRKAAAIKSSNPSMSESEAIAQAVKNEKDRILRLAGVKEIERQKVKERANLVAQDDSSGGSLRNTQKRKADATAQKEINSLYKEIMTNPTLKYRAMEKGISEKEFALQIYKYRKKKFGG